MKISYPQSVMYATRVTFEYVVAQYLKQYSNIDPQTNAPLLGSLSGSTWTPAEVSKIQRTFYDYVGDYYANSAISYDDIDYWVKRFNAMFRINWARIERIMRDNGLPIGTSETEHRDVTDKNTLNNGYTEKYTRNGKNTVENTSKSNTQNAVTNREQSSGESKGTTEYGEGYDIARSRDGKTDLRQTETDYSRQEITPSDIERFLSVDVISMWIDGFHTLFMEVI